MQSSLWYHYPCAAWAKLAECDTDASIICWFEPTTTADGSRVRVEFALGFPAAAAGPAGAASMAASFAAPAPFLFVLALLTGTASAASLRFRVSLAGAASLAL